MLINIPVPFEGTDEEKKANYNSHTWGTSYDEVRCSVCDCKPWHYHAEYPCGVEAPRMDIEAGDFSAFRFVD